VEIVQDDANVYVQQYCRAIHPSTRAVVFLDPFATQVEWDTVEAIAATHAMDVWILFPLMAVNTTTLRRLKKN
jgi:three-Cys-motif partner protein